MLLFISASAAQYPIPAGQYASSSVLSSGQWYKISLKENGIYRIEYSRLKQLGLANPSNPRIYGNNTGQLSYYTNDPSPDDLKEIPLLLIKGSDGIFNEGDYLLFYAQGTIRWRYNYAGGRYDYFRHHYSDSAYYFLTSTPLPGKMIQPGQQVSDPVNYSTSSSDALFCHEVESENLIKSGREWYQPVSSISGLQVNPGFSALVAGEEISYRIRVAGRSSIPSMFRFYEGPSLLESILVPEVNLLSTTGMYARDVLTEGSCTPSVESPSFELRFFNNGEQGARGWIDYIQLFARQLISFSGKTTEFSDSRSIGPGRVTEYSLTSSRTGFSIWDITDPFNPEVMEYSSNGNIKKFKARTDSLRYFIAFSEDAAMVPVFRTKQLTNQDLHGSKPADMVIVAHPLFVKYAQQLAGIHLQNSGLVSAVFTPEEIYNEFSGGIPDIAAIRNFLRMKFLAQAGSEHPLRYLLLFGDGSYENKTLPPHNPNFVPTWQSQNSLIVVSSFTSDDFYGLLENGEGEAEGTEDIGIGRFPVSDTLQASIMVQKVRSYLGTDSRGDWRNIITIAADDEDGNTHMLDAEGLYSLVNTDYPDFNVEKIYLDSFRQVTSVNGQSYPDVTSAINDRINRGCLIFDYLGHGNEIGLAHERVVKTENINSWRNGGRLPLFITATCEFSRFDDIDISPVNREMTARTSAGEMVILNPDGGGIALMTTTRVVYSAPNYTLNRNILASAFTRDSLSNAIRLGDIIRIAKLNSGGSNKRNFLLLGDPALRLAYPWHGRVVTDSVNSTSVTMPVDSVKALSVIKVSGHVQDNDGNLISDFNGIVYPLVFDKLSKIKTLANDGGQVMEFDLRNNIIFSGKTRASEGKFSFSFIVPRDIDYSYGNGKISYYALIDDRDMGGSYTDFIVGGFSNITQADTSGPEISLYLNDTLFREGGICDDKPVLLAIIEDEGGINTTGSGIGHDLTAYLDNERNSSFLLNRYFETDLDNYRRGRIQYQLGNISEGSHSITLKAWDNYNNSSEESLKFLVKTEQGFLIDNLLNYPNPVTDGTSFTAEHNRPEEELEITLYIYSMNGKAIRILITNVSAPGYRIPPIYWDGNEDGGRRVGRGIYPYMIIIRTGKGEVSRASGRLIIL